MIIDIQLTVSNSDATRTTTAVSSVFGVPATQAGVKTVVASYLKGIVHNYESELAIKNISITDISLT